MPLVPAVGQCSYGSFTFSPYVETTVFDAKPQRDQANRTITHTALTITLRDTITSQGSLSLDQIMASASVQLQQDAGAFQYVNKGFGNLTVNMPGSAVRDVKWGPKVLGLTFKPTGNQAAKLTWTIELNIPMSCVSPQYQFALMAANYSVSYTTDAHGYSTRTVKGYLEIPMTRNSPGDRTLSDDADSYFEKIFPDAPPGFKPLPRSRDLSEDKRRLDFTISYEEMPPMPWQTSVVEPKVTHSISNTPGNLSKWTGVMRGTYVMSRDVPRYVAIAKFLEFAVDRIDYTSSRPTGIQPGEQIFVVPLAFTMDEDVYGREGGTFSLTYSFTSHFSALLGNSAFWKQLSSADYGKWKASLANTVFAPRGNAGLRHAPSEDAIIDPCLQPAVPLDDAGGVTQLSTFTQTSLRTIPKPVPSSSWLGYEAELHTISKPSLMAMKQLPLVPLQQVSLRTTTLQDLLTRTAPSGLANISGQVPAGVLDVVQQRATPRNAIWLVGRAMRAGYEIPAPQIDSIGGVPVIPAGGTFVKKMVANLTIPVQMAYWALKFILPGNQDGALVTPPNPTLYTN